MEIKYQANGGTSTLVVEQILVGVDGKCWLRSRERFTPLTPEGLATAIKHLPGFAAMLKAASNINTGAKTP